MNLMIERSFIMVLLLSISGLVFCAMFLPLERYADRLASAKTLAALHTASLISFLLPFYFVASIWDRSEYLLRNYTLLVFEDQSIYEYMVARIREQGWIQYVPYVWFAGMLVFSAVCIGRYFCFRRNIKRNQFPLTEQSWKVPFEILKKEKGISDIALIGCYSIPIPCTVGIRKKYIMIPAEMIGLFDTEEILFLLQHEMQHVLHRDVFKKFLLLLLNAVHWFHPLYYLLRNHLSDWMEMACDEEATKIFGKEEKKRYCSLILKILELEMEKPKAIQRKGFAVPFAGSAVKQYKRRMMRIMKSQKRNNRFGKVIVTSAAVAAMISGNVVAKAADMQVNQMFSSRVKVVNSEDVEEVILEEAMAELESGYIEYTSEGAFVEVTLQNTADTTYEIFYKDGTSEIVNAEQTQAEARHTHTMVDITLKEHKKLSDGSCKTTYYDAQKCTSCGKIIKGDIIKTVTEDPCTH